MVFFGRMVRSQPGKRGPCQFSVGVITLEMIVRMLVMGLWKPLVVKMGHAAGRVMLRVHPGILGVI